MFYRESTEPLHTAPNTLRELASPDILEAAVPNLEADEAVPDHHFGTDRIEKPQAPQEPAGARTAVTPVFAFRTLEQDTFGESEQCPRSHHFDKASMRHLIPATSLI